MFFTDWSGKPRSSVHREILEYLMKSSSQLFNTYVNIWLLTVFFCCGGMAGPYLIYSGHGELQPLQTLYEILCPRFDLIRTRTSLDSSRLIIRAISAVIFLPSSVTPVPMRLEKFFFRHGVTIWCPRIFFCVQISSDVNISRIFTELTHLSKYQKIIIKIEPQPINMKIEFEKCTTNSPVVATISLFDDATFKNIYGLAFITDFIGISTGSPLVTSRANREISNIWFASTSQQWGKYLIIQRKTRNPTLNCVRSRWERHQDKRK